MKDEEQSSVESENQTLKKYVWHTSDLNDELRELRKVIAEAEGIKPYEVFHDSSLKEMSNSFPQNRSDFLKIDGVGKFKLEKYGNLFLEKINAYCKKYSIEHSLNTNLQETMQLCKQKLSIEEIAQKRKLAPRTILKHLVDLIELGEDISIDHLVTNDKQKSIREVISILGDKTLKPIKEQLGDDYTYDEIRLVRALMQASDMRSSN